MELACFASGGEVLKNCTNPARCIVGTRTLENIIQIYTGRVEEMEVQLSKFMPGI